MSRFLVLNFQDFGLNHNITDTIQPRTLFCICCLSKNVPLLNLPSCRHAVYLSLIGKPQLKDTKEVVCYYCHGMLKKIEKFREQAINSFKLLEKEAFNITTKDSIAQRFNRTQTLNIYLAPEREPQQKKVSEKNVSKKKRLDEDSNAKMISEQTGTEFFITYFHGIAKKADASVKSETMDWQTTDGDCLQKVKISNIQAIKIESIDIQNKINNEVDANINNIQINTEITTDCQQNTSESDGNLISSKIVSEESRVNIQEIPVSETVTVDIQSTSNSNDEIKTKEACDENGSNVQESVADSTNIRKNIDTESNIQEITVSESAPSELARVDIVVDDDVVGEETQQKPNTRKDIQTIKLSKGELRLERLRLSQSAEYLKFPYRCEYCLIGFQYEDNIKDHINRKHGPKLGSVTCEICLQVLHPPGSLNAHNFRHYTRYECCMCCKRYVDFNEALQHYRTVHETPVVHKCDVCNYVTRYQIQLNRHMLKHERYTCKECGYYVNTEVALQRHLRVVHKKTNVTYDIRTSQICKSLKTKMTRDASSSPAHVRRKRN